MYREDKATAMAVHFLKLAPEHKLDDLALMKLMVIAERTSMDQTTSLITGARFVSMQNGPVLSEVLDSLKEKSPSGVWQSYIGFISHRGKGTPSNHCVLKRDLCIQEYLSEFEINLIESVWNEHGNSRKWKLVEVTHAFPEWDKSCETSKTSTPISLESIYELGFQESPATALLRAQEIEYFESVGA